MAFLPTSLHFLIIQIIHESDIQFQTVFRLIFFYTFSILKKKCNVCACDEYIFLNDYKKIMLPYVKIQRK